MASFNIQIFVVYCAQYLVNEIEFRQKYFAYNLMVATPLYKPNLYPGWSSTNAIKIARTAEAAVSQLTDIRHAEPSTRIIALTSSGNNSKHQTHPSRLCTKHDQTKISLRPAFTSECRKCHKLHHWERVCHSNEVKPPKNPTVPIKGRKQSKHLYALNQSDTKDLIQIQTPPGRHPIDLNPSSTNITAFGYIGSKYPFHVL